MTVTDTAHTPVAAFQHEALLYRDEDEFLSAVGRYVRDGFEAGESVVVAVPSPRLDMLRDSLAGDPGEIQFLDMESIGANPARIIDRWQRTVDRYVGSGRRLRGVGEPAWPGRRDAELLECQLHELLINQVFSPGAPWRLLCPYDEAKLPKAVIERVSDAHPMWWDDSRPAATRPSDTYRHDSARAFFTDDLPPPPPSAVAHTYTKSEHLAAVRDTVRSFARASALAPAQVESVVFASSELAANSIRHGDGAGTLTMWREPDSVVVQISDRGYIADPLVGRLAANVDAVGGRGIYLANQLCDLVQLRSSPAGTTARIRAWTVPAS